MVELMGDAGRLLMCYGDEIGVWQCLTMLWWLDSSWNYEIFKGGYPQKLGSQIENFVYIGINSHYMTTILCPNLFFMLFLAPASFIYFLKFLIVMKFVGGSDRKSVIRLYLL